MRFGHVVSAALLMSVACTADRISGPMADVPMVAAAMPATVSPALSASLDPATTFEVVHTPLFDGLAINDAGLVVGEAFSSAGAATWTVADGLEVIGPLPGGGDGRFYDVNSAGQAVGVTNFPGYTKATYWSQATNAYLDLGIPATGPYAHAIADNGDVFGTAFEGYARAFFKPNGGAAVFLLASAPFVAVHSADMNNNGVLVGVGLVTDFVSHAIMWPRFDLPLIALDHLPGDRSKAEAVNDAGDIVGWSEITPGSSTRHALLWPATGGMIDLTMWSNGCSGTSQAFGVNDGGVIVGHCNNLPVLWTATEGMRYLPPPNWGSGQGMVRRINNNLEMVGGEAYWRVANQTPSANAGGPYTGLEGRSLAFDGSGSSDQDGDALTYDWNFGDGGTGTGVAPSHTYADNGTYTVTLIVTDVHGVASAQATSSVVIDNIAPTLGALLGPTDPIGLLNGGASASFNVSFSDPGTLDTHGGTISCDGGSAGTVSVAETAGSGSATAACNFSAAGVYEVSITLSDDDGGSDSKTSLQYVVIYDPDGGFVTGGGWITSPPGAYPLDPSSSGKATFGFVSRYSSGASVPSGNTEFQFHAAGFNFSSAFYQWLVVAGARAQYKGEGTVNGQSGYSFLLSAVDGQVNGGGGVDRFRIKIWDTASGTIVYDNMMGGADDIDSANPQALGGGSISIKK
jgi:probable HAF family extracellular repeat protein